MKHNKRKATKLYLFREDIKELNAEYSLLYSYVKNDQNFSTAQIERACEVLLEKYNFEIEELSNFREAEYWEQQAKIEAKNAEETPWRRCWLWALLFQPLTNRAQDIIEERAALDAEERFNPIEKELEERAKILYAGTGKKLSRRKRQKLMKKFLKLRDRLIGDTVATAPELPAPTLEDTEPAPAACDESDQSAEIPAADVAEPPEPPARKPRNKT